MPVYAVAGVTGKTGGAAARTLLAMHKPLRVIVRDSPRGGVWKSRGAQVAVADLLDARSLATAFAGVRAAYVLNPPAYTSDDLFARAEEVAGAILEASERSGLRHLVVLSSIGAHRASETGNILTNRILEAHLGRLGARVTFLRPAYFMENWAWAAKAAAGGTLPTFLFPLDRRIPMVSVEDVGHLAAEIMLSGVGRGVVELSGREDYSPDDAAEAFSKAMRRRVVASAVPEETWPATLAGFGFTPRTIEAWVELFRGFNSGRIHFEEAARVTRANVSLQRAVEAIVADLTRLPQRGQEHAAPAEES